MSRTRQTGRVGRSAIGASPTDAIAMERKDSPLCGCIPPCRL